MTIVRTEIPDNECFISFQLCHFIFCHAFAIIEEADREKRLEMESKLVSTVSFCPVCCPSDTWMGNVSPVEKIRRSGMWQVNELYKEPLDTGDMDDLMANLVT